MRPEQNGCCTLRHQRVWSGMAGQQPSKQTVRYTACLTDQHHSRTDYLPGRLHDLDATSAAASIPQCRPGAGKLPGRPATVTVLGPPEQRSLLEHTARFVPLVVAVFEALLGCRLPYPALHVVRTAVNAGTTEPYSLRESLRWVEDA